MALDVTQLTHHGIQDELALSIFTSHLEKMCESILFKYHSDDRITIEDVAEDLPLLESIPDFCKLLREEMVTYYDAHSQDSDFEAKSLQIRNLQALEEKIRTHYAALVQKVQRTPKGRQKYVERLESLVQIYQERIAKMRQN